MGLKVIANAGDTTGLKVPKGIITEVGGEVLFTGCTTEDDFIEKARDASAVIMFFIAFRMNAKIMDNLPKLRHICNTGVGYDGVDLLEASERGIAVTNNPYYCLDEVSTQAFTLLMALSRNIFQIKNAVKEGSWGGSDPKLRSNIFPHINRINGQTLGIVGLGNIGRTLVSKARGCGMKVIAYDPYVAEAIMCNQFGVEKVSFEDLLQRSDYISIHAKLTDETNKMFKSEQFRMMKPTAYLINTARGPIVDEVALTEALTKGWISGAGLDVSEFEPIKPGNPLLAMDNVIVTGHTAFYSNESQDDLWQTAFKNVALSIQSKFPDYCVNPEVEKEWLKRWSSSK